MPHHVFRGQKKAEEQRLIQASQRLAREADADRKRKVKKVSEHPQETPTEEQDEHRR